MGGGTKQCLCGAVCGLLMITINSKADCKIGCEIIDGMYDWSKKY